MMKVIVPVLAALAATGLLLASGFGQDSVTAVKELQPRPVTLTGKVSLTRALAQLKEQTGNAVADRRPGGADPLLALDLAGTTFWQSLDDIAHKAGCAVSLYQADGAVALVEGPARKMPVAYSGLFRLAARRLSVTRDEAAGSHTCSVSLEAAWEPRFLPFYLEVGPITVDFAPDVGGKVQQVELPSRGQMHIGGRSAAEIDVVVPAPPRSVPKIASLKGRLSVTGPVKMLDFAFADLKPIKSSEQGRTEMKEGVKVALTRLTLSPDGRATVDVTITNPPGGPRFESYQSWLDNNRLALVRVVNGKRQELIARDHQVIALTADRAEISYSIANVSAPLSAWNLTYRTPSRIVEVPVPFAFTDIALP